MVHPPMNIDPNKTLDQVMCSSTKLPEGKMTSFYTITVGLNLKICAVFNFVWKFEPILSNVAFSHCLSRCLKCRKMFRRIDLLLNFEFSYPQTIPVLLAWTRPSWQNFNFRWTLVCDEFWTKCWRSCRSSYPRMVLWTRFVVRKKERKRERERKKERNPYLFAKKTKLKKYAP